MLERYLKRIPRPTKMTKPPPPFEFWIQGSRSLVVTQVAEGKKEKATRFSDIESNLLVRLSSYETNRFPPFHSLSSPPPLQKRKEKFGSQLIMKFVRYDIQPNKLTPTVAQTSRESRRFSRKASSHILEWVL